MRTVRESVIAELTPLVAQRLWTDVSRWPTFVDGFSRVVEADPEWPQTGSKLVWQSTPAGRGRVTERVRELTPGEVIVTQIFEDQLSATQRVHFDPDSDGSLVTVEFEYELQKGGPLRGLTDVLFIRRALSDMLARTLRRFSTEAAEEANL
jgi:polyketide cyclase/dehydrase/lipid transport protein